MLFHLTITIISSSWQQRQLVVILFISESTLSIHVGFFTHHILMQHHHYLIWSYSMMVQSNSLMDNFDSSSVAFNRESTILSRCHHRIIHQIKLEYYQWLSQDSCHLLFLCQLLVSHFIISSIYRFAPSSYRRISIQHMNHRWIRIVQYINHPLDLQEHIIMILFK